MNNEVEQKKERSPKVETATKPWDSTSGRGDNAEEASSYFIVPGYGATCKREGEKGTPSETQVDRYRVAQNTNTWQQGFQQGW